MTRIKILARCICLSVGLAATGCHYPDAYVFTPREFDRSAPGFRKLPANLSSVTVCAKPFGDIDDRIASLADQECRRFGRIAQKPERGFGVCPMLLASAITFRCAAAAS